MPALDSNVPMDTVQEVFRAYSHARKERESAAGAERAVLAQAKSKGVPPDELRQMYADYRADPDEIRQEIEKRIRNAAFIGKDIGFQATMLTDVAAEAAATPAHQEWAADQAGFESGKAGGDRNESNPFNPGSEQRVAWDKGFMRGQAAIAEQMAVNGGVKPARTGRKKRQPGGALQPDTAETIAAAVAEDGAAESAAE